MSTEIVKQSPTIIRSFDDAERAATAMAASGFFQDSRSAAQAVVKILAGQELGFGPFASMTGISIIQGRPAIGANLIAAAIKRSGRYDYRILRLDETGCEIAFFDRGQEIGRAAFNEEDAKRAGLLDKDTWRKYRRNMYFARAISNGARWYCPDIFGGGPVYTPEELGAAVNEAGEVVDAPVVELPTEPAPVQPSEPPPAPAVPGDVTEVAPADPAPTAPQAHWIDDAKTSAAFWARAHERGLTQADVLAALGVERVHDYPGTLAEAGEAIKRYIAAKGG